MFVFRFLAKKMLLWNENIYFYCLENEQSQQFLFQYLINMKKIPAYTPQELLPIIRKFMAQRYSEGYTKGVHDEDAKLILYHLLKINNNIDLLRYSADSRACANLYWNVFEEEKRKNLLNEQIKSTGLILQLFPKTTHFAELLNELEIGIENFVTKTKLFNSIEIRNIDH